MSASRTLVPLTQYAGKVHVGVIVRNRKRLIVSGRFELQPYNAPSGDLPCVVSNARSNQCSTFGYIWVSLGAMVEWYS